MSLPGAPDGDARLAPAGVPFTYEVVGARGGQGTTTVALVLALAAAERAPTVLAATRPGDAAALAGVPEGQSSPQLAPGLTLVGRGGAAAWPGMVRVEDFGRLSDLDLPAPPGSATTRRWLVVRGPCYLSLKAAVDAPWRPDAVVVLAEPGRCLGADDVEAVLGAEVSVQVPVDAEVARILDAGLLPARLQRVGALRALVGAVHADLAALAPDLAGPPARRDAVPDHPRPPVHGGRSPRRR